MDNQRKKENLEDIENTTDNFSQNMTNEQLETENIEETSDDTDNPSVELEKLKDSHLRLIAEYDNYRKRTLKEKAELIKSGGEKILVGLLPVIDDFERALENINSVSQAQDSLVEGVELIYNKFMSFLNQNGVHVLETKDKEFDADLFDAIATIPVDDDSMKGKVIDCVQKGYTLNDKVIRHAKVVVAG